MKYFTCSVRDNKHFGLTQPFVVPQISEASRWFTDSLDNTAVPMGKNPQDYDLVLICIYDSTTLELEHSQLEILVSGADYINLKKSETQLELSV